MELFKNHSMKIPRIKRHWKWIIICLAIITILAAVPLFFKLREAGRVGLAKNILTGAYIAEAGYKEEHGSFSSSLEDAGYSFQMAGVFIYSDSSQVPDKIKRVLPPESLPFVKKDAYLILLALNFHDTWSYWSINEKNEISEYKPVQ